MVSDIVRRYPATVFWTDEDGGFIATAPDLPGCSAFGETQEQALVELEQAIEAWIEAARAAGNPIPEPSRPAIEPQPSGRLLVRMPGSLHARLVQEAKREHVSLNQYVVFLLTTGFACRSMEYAVSRAFSDVSAALFSAHSAQHRSFFQVGHSVTFRQAASTDRLVPGWNEVLFAKEERFR
jgi:antitoxin HicB